MTKKSSTGPVHYDHFEIDIISALSSQLTVALDSLSEGEMTLPVINALPNSRGVYQLFHENKLVYIGKADSLPKRLREHHHKISGRQNITTNQMGFKCLSVHENWTALAPESSLISHYKSSADDECEWNGIGFGTHDPGRIREKTDKPPDGFDMRYPIRLNWVCDWIEAGEWDLLKLMIAFKDRLPYLFRYKTEEREKKRDAHYTKGHPDHRGKKVIVERRGMTAEELLVLFTKALPGWQATAFPSHLILYNEEKDANYVHGRVLHRELPQSP